MSKRRNRRMRINPWLVKLIDGNLVLTETRGDVSIVVTVVLGDETWTAEDIHRRCLEKAKDVREKRANAWRSANDACKRMGEPAS